MNNVSRYTVIMLHFLSKNVESPLIHFSRTYFYQRNNLFFLDDNLFAKKTISYFFYPGLPSINTVSPKSYYILQLIVNESFLNVIMIEISMNDKIVMMVIKIIVTIVPTEINLMRNSYNDILV